MTDEIAICEACEIVDPQCEWTDPGCKLAEFKGITIKPRQPREIKPVQITRGRGRPPLPPEQRKVREKKPRVIKSTSPRSDYWRQNYLANRERKLAEAKQRHAERMANPEFKQAYLESRRENRKELVERVLAKVLAFGDTAHYGTAYALYAGNNEQ